MNTLMNRIAVAAALFGVLAPMAPATAQVEDLLKHGQGSGAASGGLGKLGGIGSALSGGSLASGSTGNVAGLLEFCLKNNFLSGQDSASVKDKLMGKLGGTPPESGYEEGTQGVLKSGDGKQVDLSGGGLKEQATKQICDKVLAQAKSML
jgi:hypothetical protein